MHGTYTTILIGLVMAFIGPLFPCSAQSALSLDDLLEQSAESHPLLRAAHSRSIAAEADVDAVRSAWYPYLSAGPLLSASGMDYGSSDRAILYQSLASVSIDKLVWDFGSTDAAEAAAYYTAKGTRATELKTRRDIELGVAEAYVEMVLATRINALRKRTLSARIELRDKVANLVKAGVRPASHLTRAQVDLENAKMNLASAEYVASIRSTELSDAIGVANPIAGELVNILESLPDAVDRDQIRRRAMKDRQELVIANAEIESLWNELEAARRGNYPSLSVGGSASFMSQTTEDDTSGSSSLSTPEDENVEWAVFAQLGWSAYNAAEQNASIRALAARRAANKSERNNTIRSIATEVDVFEKRLAEAVERVGTAQAVVKAAIENQVLTVKRYGSGASTILDVTVGQVTVTTAEAAVLRAKADAWIMYWRLMRSAGMPLRANP